MYEMMLDKFEVASGENNAETIRDAFALLSLSPVFDICLEKLARHYENAQARVHPDLVGQGSALWKNSCHALAVRLGQAYETLRHPVSRARLLLELNNLWPVPIFPDVAEEIWAWQETQPTYEQIQQRHADNLSQFAQAFHKGNAENMQRAYWWILRTQAAL